jgi:beta-glucosidase
MPRSWRNGSMIGGPASRTTISCIHVMGSSFPFGVRSQCRDVLLEAHRKGAQALRAGPARFPVGMTLALRDLLPVAGGETMCEQIRRQSEDVFLEAARADDFLGVQCYTRQRINAQGLMPPEPGIECTQIGYEFWPEALEATIRYASARAQVPIIVTENGVATEDDSRRCVYVERALAGIANCLRDGIDVRGYFY